MLTRTAPILAVAYCVIVHSAQLGDQIPTRSPLPIPARIRPTASASTSRSSSAQVHRRPLATSTSASRSGWAATVRSKLAPIVSSSSTGSSSPAAYDVMPASVVTAAPAPLVSRDLAGFCSLPGRAPSQVPPNLRLGPLGRINRDQSPPPPALSPPARPGGIRHDARGPRRRPRRCGGRQAAPHPHLHPGGRGSHVHQLRRTVVVHRRRQRRGAVDRRRLE